MVSFGPKSRVLRYFCGKYRQMHLHLSQIVIAPLFGIAQMVYFLGVAETLLGAKKH